jgi:hypothetical protein
MTNRFKALQVFTIFTGVGAVSYFLYFWQWNYSSDTALVGMVARRFFSHGELPIFVGGVGYQGLLLEVPMAAALFQDLGQLPQCFGFGAGVFYTLLLVALYRVVCLSFSSDGGMAVGVVSIFSPPQWYGVVSAVCSQLSTDLPIWFGTVSYLSKNLAEDSRWQSCLCTRGGGVWIARGVCVLPLRTGRLFLFCDGVARLLLLFEGPVSGRAKSAQGFVTDHKRSAGRLACGGRSSPCSALSDGKADCSRQPQ